MVAMGITDGAAAPTPAPHAVLFPFSALGHVRPVLQLARRLAYVHGFKVTVVTTSHIYKRLGFAHATRAEDNIQHIDLEEGFPESYYTADTVRVLIVALTTLGPLVKELLGRIHRSILPITCVISDMLCNEAHKAALHYGIPSVALSCQCALALSSKYYWRRLVAEGLLPLPKDELVRKETLLKVVTCVPGMYPMTLGEYHTGLLVDDMEEGFFKYLTGEHSVSLHERAWILQNTVHELEKEVVEAMEQDAGMRLLSIGPLAISPMTLNGSIRVDDDDNSTTSFWPEESKCMNWLDSQSPVSVVYASFGSLANVAPGVLEDILLGLEASQVPFLFVIRVDLTRGLATSFQGFQERTKDRGLIVAWAPQLRVLSHPAIAAFLTHCGWNSILESVSAGVPMLCYPCFVDQPMNSRFIVSVWKIGLELEKRADGSLDRIEVAKRLQAVASKDSEMRVNANTWKDVTRRAVQPGGSSHNNMLTFVADMYKRAASNTATLITS
ncbi:hypothetical protein KC19_1G309500 [Ceratodon purpureus]|uniref:Glycosyltransferase n=1 Tax=Ceratodon purpureus TaxID=3225 RepID=A0A8T0JDN1_CERPU|nr:hypothetical protein KC19_1G309500 [Ceratodon purpureus]